ncbi:PREDICTED: uncharacterized protein LOC105561839 [Vollenhovia emeryi]|uniref:uncharacterized protein LOC105561839 n=1 Tax=Vollenhovia emeryi TaxID=411798 RepID=UPI0005F4C0C7|nr:PREDICTED: uncharacterized protein LOC105561839 [Vollenhovia emeryi]
MPRRVYVLLLLYATIILNAECASGIRDRCSELIEFDVDEIENHLSELNLTDVPTVKMMTAGFKCPVSDLPFGALKSDWARLLLLREAQPDGSIVKLKLVRLMRLLIIAYYQMEERIQATGPEAQAAEKSLVGETTTTTDETSPSNGSNFSGPETPGNNASRRCSRTDSFSNDITRLATRNDCPGIKSSATIIEIATMRNLPSPNGTAADVPPSATRQNVTSSIDPGGAKKAALKILGNCLKHSFKDVARAQSKVFEIVRDKARKGNEIDDRGGDRTLIRLSSPANESWQHVTFATRAPLTLSGIAAPAYRTRGSNGLRKSPRKLQKRMKLNKDLYEVFRRFYGVGENEKGTK